MGEKSWDFGDYKGETGDDLYGVKYLYELYEKSCPGYDGIVTVPMLWDKQQECIVNNESSEIIRMFNSAFSGFTAEDYDYYPEELRATIDEINQRVYDDINNGVYKTGFAKTQSGYEKAFDALFAALDAVENILASQRYLAGDRITEADWRLFPSLIRFDPVYVGHFKCNLRRIMDYPNLSNYLRELYQVPGIAATVKLDHIKDHYYWSHVAINPTRIIPKGPEIDWLAPHDRGN